jgi:hypothetical protein
VLIDDATDLSSVDARMNGCGVVRSSLLETCHNLQPLGILNHGFEDGYKLEDDRIQKIDSILLKVLKIDRTSDTKSFSVRVQMSKTGLHCPAATLRLEIILLLLQAITSTTDIPRIIIPQIFHHKTLSIQFKSPNMLSPSSKPVYAIWGISQPMPNFQSMFY